MASICTLYPLLGWVCVCLKALTMDWNLFLTSTVICIYILYINIVTKRICAAQVNLFESYFAV